MEFLVVLDFHIWNCTWIKALTKSGITAEIESILESINDHVALLSLHWVIWVVTVCEG